MTNIVIVGGGFGGIYTIKNLIKQLYGNESVKISLINPTNYFLFTPMIHETATGGLDYEHVIEPIRDVFHDIELIIDTVEEIDLNTQTVSTKSRRAKIPYDFLVLSPGAKSNDYGTVGVAQNSYALKTLQDAQSFKNALVSLFEANYKDEKIINIIGAGPTGIELLFEIHEFVNGSLLKTSSDLKNAKIQINLLTNGADILTYFSPKSQKIVKEKLAAYGIQILYNCVIEKIEEKLIVYTTDTNKEKKLLHSDLTVWVAGVTPNEIKMTPQVEKDNQKRIIVNKYLQLETHPNVFVLGDAASGFPMLAYTATRQAGCIAKNIVYLAQQNEKKSVIEEILKKFNSNGLQEFKFSPRIRLLSLGQLDALGEIGTYVIRGTWVWFIWRTVYLTKVVSFRRKAKIALNWTFNLFYPRDISKF